MNPKVQALIVRAQTALNGRPPLGGSIAVDFGKDAGCVLVTKTNGVGPLPVRPASLMPPPDCTITLSLDTLSKIEGGSVWPFIDGEVQIDGDRSLAEKFGSILKAAA